MLHSVCQQIWKTQQWPWDWKRSVFIPIPKIGSAKECSNYCAIVLISHASKVVFKILQAKFQQYVNWELPDVQTAFRKGRGTRDQTANIHLITEKAREFQKKIICFIDYAKSFHCGVTTNCKLHRDGNTQKWEYQTTLPTSWETCMQVKKQQNWTWNNGLVPNWERSMSRLYIVTMCI